MDTFLTEDLLGNTSGVDGKTVVMACMAKLGNRFSLDIQAKQAAHLPVTVLLDDIDSIVTLNEVLYAWTERNGPQSQVTGLQLVLSQKPVTALHHSPVAAAVSDEPDSCIGVLVDHGTGHSLAGSFILAVQTVHIVDIIVRAFG